MKQKIISSYDFAMALQGGISLKDYNFVKGARFVSGIVVEDYVNLRIQQGDVEISGGLVRVVDNINLVR